MVAIVDREGCIGCTLCQRTCKHDAIHVVDNLAVIDYSKCVNCGECVDVCPRKLILRQSTHSAQPAGPAEA